MAAQSGVFVVPTMLVRGPMGCSASQPFSRKIEFKPRVRIGKEPYPWSLSPHGS